ncbi:hypothetical protein [Streptomyces zagrosensis]|uniref:Uncharacterized protein n=1 Tax=Streptomyces zagrosensis TaxID=1042984 RepID=A0A7W9QE22_9ACTN|nr:hypothetical protein [Streptomyces zagrosensis]MBB5938560.1 hypothetical protein [Streptomyces zagrosensis]
MSDVSESEFIRVTGKVVARRVLNVETPYPVIEISTIDSGTMAGRQVEDIVTYVQRARPTGVFEGSAEVVVSSPDGEVIAVWKGYGRGRSDGRGGIKWVGGILVESTSEELNGIAAYGHFDVTGDGKVTQRFYRVR